MRYWWVNQNQTFKQELAGGYLWSPKRNRNGARNPFYEQMREVSPGDLILSFQGTFIRAVGVARSFAYESPKPTEFGSAGANWGAIGWRVDVSFSQLQRQIRPAEHMDKLRRLLPSKYSPLMPNGNGLQSVYLTTIPEGLMEALSSLIGPEATELMSALIEDRPALVRTSDEGLSEWEEHIKSRLKEDTSLDQTEREQIILARRGQGKFKRNVGMLESSCRITHVSHLEHLRASHIKPWRDCETNEGRLDGENGLLLTPTIDHFFDRGFVSFEDTGQLLVSPVAHIDSLKKMGVPVEGTKCGDFTSGQRKHLEFHREFVFLRSALSRKQSKRSGLSAKNQQEPTPRPDPNITRS